ncbi:MAG TPA: hypothetical protein VH986_10845 [Acidimicrobiia bacterium]|jgi:hypothetical protein
MPTLTDIDLTDPAPPLPGERERAAVRARARQITRRRRTLQAGGAVAAGVIVAVGAIALVSSGSGDRAAPVALVRVQPAVVVRDATVTVRLQNDDGRFEGVADGNGTVHFDPPAAPGTYKVFVTVESAPATGGDPGVDIGTAVITYRSIVKTLDEGVNLIDLDQLTPEAPTSTATR